MSEQAIDVERVQTLVRQLYDAVGLNAPAAKNVVDIRYEDAPQGGSYAFHVDEDGKTVRREYFPPMRKGMRAADGEL